MDHYRLKLYIAGQSPRSRLAIRNLNRICETELQNRCEVQIVDVLEQPRIAEADKILATPTLVKELPLPSRRIIGDLSNTERLLEGLEIRVKDGAEY
jgi:circadian clock protein KaiB